MKSILTAIPEALIIDPKTSGDERGFFYRRADISGSRIQGKALLHNTRNCTAHRPSGTCTVLEEGNGFKIKRIEVKPSVSLSLQMHRHHSEHRVVVNGSANVVNTSEFTFIPAGHKHRLTNFAPCLA